jgi:hypothetical protein
MDARGTSLLDAIRQVKILRRIYPSPSVSVIVCSNTVV